MIFLGGQEDSSFVETNMKGQDTIAMTLEKWGNESIKKLRDSLRRSVRAGGPKNLEQSLITLPIQLGQDRFLLTIQGQAYWKYINEGVGGAGGERKSEGKPFINKAPQSRFKFTTKRPPINFSALNGSSLLQWAQRNGFNEYALRESIFRQGIKATHFYDDVMTQKWINTLAKRLEKSGAKEVELIIKHAVSGNNG